MRTSVTLMAALAVTSLTACKSLPFGSFNLLNSPAMDVAELAPTIEIAPAERESINADGEIIGMAISGGGMRASAFTLGVFAGLGEIRGPDGRSALELVDFASSNSGGSWALAALLGNRYSNPRFVPENDFDTYAKKFAGLNESSTKHWAEAMQAMLPANLTMGDIRSVRPLAFFNSTILPSHDPFVFDEAFARKYRVNRFGARASKREYGQNGAIATLPLGYVAATSGSVPGFTHSYAKTGLCDDANWRPSFCGSNNDGGWLRLVDGGLYDNAAYKTAWEVARTVKLGTPTTAKKPLMILIDAKTGWPMPTLNGEDARDHDGLFTSGRKLLIQGSFPLQEATYRRMATPMFEAIGYDSILLDFNAASRFTKDMPVRTDDLPELLAMAADKIDCITDDGEVRKASARKRPATLSAVDWLESRGGDCLANNLARVGYHHKTTYYFDRTYFAATYQLGVFVARRQADPIRRKLGWAL